MSNLFSPLDILLRLNTQYHTNFSLFNRSIDSGATWTSTNAGAHKWWSLDCSDDGALAVSGAFNENLYTYPSASSSESDDTCFSGDTMVTLFTGDEVPIRKIQMGDRILAVSSKTGDVVPSAVLAVPHGPNNHETTFVELTTASGKDLRLTPSHLILSGSCEAGDGWSGLELVEAATVAVGSCLRGASPAQREMVTSVRSFRSKGVYTLVTEEPGFLLVNGLVASPFASSHRVGDALYTFHRFLYSNFPAAFMVLSSILERGTQVAADMVILVGTIR